MAQLLNFEKKKKKYAEASHHYGDIHEPFSLTRVNLKCNTLRYTFYFEHTHTCTHTCTHIHILSALQCVPLT